MHGTSGTAGCDGGPIAALIQCLSLEVTAPRRDELAALRGLLPADSRVYLSAVPGQPPERLVEAASAVCSAGFRPVPHIAARRYSSAPALADTLARLAGEAGTREVLVIGGDQPAAAGPFTCALDVIDSGLLQARGIMDIGIAAYPDGHPHIAAATLDQALTAKLAATRRGGLTAHVVTQFCFDPVRIITFLQQLRAAGIDAPVRIGMAGPASITTLLRYAGRCGVAVSARGLARNPGLLRGLLTDATPGAILAAVAAANDGGALGSLAPHLFSFGGAVATARWAQAIAAGAETEPAREHVPERR
jgi:methylenetetrahydrofolate reductase (NADPH)